MGNYSSKIKKIYNATAKEIQNLYEPIHVELDLPEIDNPHNIEEKKIENPAEPLREQIVKIIQHVENDDEIDALVALELLKIINLIHFVSLMWLIRRHPCLLYLL